VERSREATAAFMQLHPLSNDATGAQRPRGRN
jgi:hypothetical protein